jgi:exopolyphosphatase / guanosine-5'-triphosphate,3'-diphosphate pyrophosphatase
MIIASIDIGSNTVLLLIAEFNINNGNLTTLSREYSAPRISRGLVELGDISNESITSLLNVLDRYQNIIKENKAEVVLVKGTNALRIAGNKTEIQQIINKRYDWNLEVISGNDEAYLTFIGSTHGIFPSKNSRNTLDIGGGSTEVISGISDKIKFKVSMPVGVVSLSERFFVNNKIDMNSISEAQLHLTHLFSKSEIKINPDAETFAVAGTPTTLACINKSIKYFNAEAIENTYLTIEYISQIMNELQTMSPIDISSTFGQVVEGREDVLFSGTLILHTFMKLFGIYKIKVSTRGLYYGSILDYLRNNNVNISIKVL